MKIYLVGGYVRDKILNIQNHDKDYVVIGANENEMKALGFKSVGKSFPVFIHEEKEGEFALARSEKKTGKKHFDFEFDTKNISLKEDLKRRDFTINALAYDEESGEIIDYFNGLDDIKNRIIKPVSKAFCEDSLRVLRAARFKALLGNDWKLHEKLHEYSLNVKDDLKYLSRERVYQETKKAFNTNNPEIFFISLKELGVLRYIFPWFGKLSDSKLHEAMKKLQACKNNINSLWSVLFYNAYVFSEQNEQKTFMNEVLKTLSLSKEEVEISSFFLMNYSKLEQIIKNSIDISELSNFIFKIKNENFLNSLLVSLRANIKNKEEFFFSNEDILNIYKLLKSANYKVNHTNMSKYEIISKISKKQTEIVSDYIKSLNGK